MELAGREFSSIAITLAPFYENGIPTRPIIETRTSLDVMIPEMVSG
jgi:hypothetical protein